jgi:hypothetical protein
MTLPSEVQAAIVGGIVTGLFGLSYRLLRLLGWYLAERQKSANAQLPPTSRPEVSPPPDLGPVVLLIGAIGAGTAAGFVAPQAVQHLQPPPAATAPTQRCNPAACKRAGGECRGGVCTKAAETDRPAVRAVPHVSAVDAVVMIPADCDREPI